MIEGRYTGNFVGTPCFAEGKIVKINQWLEGDNNRLDNAFFYSDSHNDLPLMKEVGNPIAVDPDAKLEVEATKLGWKIISLR
jgi:phosphoserine phosphatase